MKKGEDFGSIICFRNALKLDNRFVYPIINLSVVYKKLGKQKFAVNYETGKKVNGRKIIKQIDELSKYLVDNVYNQARINRQIDEYNKVPLDAIHILEFLDTSELSDEIYKDITAKEASGVEFTAGQKEAIAEFKQGHKERFAALQEKHNLERDSNGKIAVSKAAEQTPQTPKNNSGATLRTSGGMDL